MQAITTARLVLEPLTAAHAEAMFEVLADLEIYRYLDYSPAPSVEHLRTVYSRLEARQSSDGSQVWLNWVVRPQQQAPIGYVQATIVSPNSAWIAYVLSSRQWGRGYAYEAALAMVERLASAYGVSRFLATVEAENGRSIRLLEGLAFRPATADETAGHELSAVCNRTAVRAVGPVLDRDVQPAAPRLECCSAAIACPVARPGGAATACWAATHQPGADS